MKNVLKITLLISISVLILQPVSGQRLLKNLKNKAREKIEQKAEEKALKEADKQADKVLDKVEEELDKGDKTTEDSDNNSQRDLMGLMKGLGIGGEPIPIEDNYSFSQLIQMKIESYNKSGEKTSDGEFITHVNPKTNCMAYQVISGDVGQSGEGMFIIDPNNKATIMLGEENGEKTGVVYGMGNLIDMVNEETVNEEIDFTDTPETYLANPNVKKTGKTKTIAGYKCEEFTYNDENTTSNYWITKDLKINSQDFFNTLFKTSVASQGMGWGYMMEANSLDKTSGEKSVIKVTKVDQKSKIKFSLGEYQITNLGSINMPTN